MSEQPGAYMGGRVTSDVQQFLADLSEYYAIIPEELLESGNASAVVVYGILDRFAEQDTCYASHTVLAEKGNLGVSTVKRAMKWLIDNEWVAVEKVGIGHNATDYRLPFKTRRLSKMNTQTVQNEQSEGVKMNHHTEKETEPSKQRKEKPSLRSGQKKELTEENIQVLVELHAPHWTEAEVRERIEDAMNHTASKKCASMYLYTRGWLKRDAERLGLWKNGASTTNGASEEPVFRARGVSR